MDFSSLGMYMVDIWACMCVQEGVCVCVCVCVCACVRTRVCACKRIKAAVLGEKLEKKRSKNVELLVTHMCVYIHTVI